MVGTDRGEVSSPPGPGPAPVDPARCTRRRPAFALAPRKTLLRNTHVKGFLRVALLHREYDSYYYACQALWRLASILHTGGASATQETYTRAHRRREGHRPEAPRGSGEP